MVQVEIGVWDWLRADWLETYYPPDLPVDWRQAYYANEYACVGLPASAWTPGELPLWADETGGKVAYWLGCDPTKLTEAATADALASLGECLAGIFFEDVGLQPARALMSRLYADGLAPAYAAEPPLAGVTPPWRPEHTDRPAAIGLYAPRLGDDVRRRRALIESFVAAPGPAQRYLFVEGAPAIVEECRQLCDLLGC